MGYTGTVFKHISFNSVHSKTYFYFEYARIFQNKSITQTSINRTFYYEHNTNFNQAFFLSHNALLTFADVMRIRMDFNIFFICKKDVILFVLLYISFTNRSQNEGLIGFTTSFSVLTMRMSANITDKGSPIAHPSICL